MVAKKHIISVRGESVKVMAWQRKAINRRPARIEGEAKMKRRRKAR